MRIWETIEDCLIDADHLHIQKYWAVYCFSHNKPLKPVWGERYNSDYMCWIQARHREFREGYDGIPGVERYDAAFFEWLRGYVGIK